MQNLANGCPGVGSIKCVTVGDGAVGKTCLLDSFTKKEFNEDHVPTVLQNFAMTLKIK